MSYEMLPPSISADYPLVPNPVAGSTGLRLYETFVEPYESTALAGWVSSPSRSSSLSMAGHNC